MLLYYITDRSALGRSEAQCRKRLLAKISEAARAGVDYVQLREKDLSIRELEALARQVVEELQAFPDTALLINSRIDVAIAVGAAGVHLPSADLPPSEARAIFTRAGYKKAVIAASCHSQEEIVRAQWHAADFVVFGPVFEKPGMPQRPGIGLSKLRAVCRRWPAVSSPMPVLALGGVTLENAADCIKAGAAGIAAIRLFQENTIAKVISELGHFQHSVGLRS